MNTEFSFKDINVDMSDIPSYASVQESVLFVLEANERMFNSLKQEIGLQELGLFEATGMTTSYVIEEGEEAKEESKENTALIPRPDASVAVRNNGAKTKIKFGEILNKIAAKIKALFEKAMRKISELISSAYKALGSWAVDEKKMLAGLPHAKIAYKSGNFDNLVKFASGEGELYQKMIAFIDSASSDANASMRALDDLKQLFKGEITQSSVSHYMEGPVLEHNQITEQDVKDIVKIVGNFKNAKSFIKDIYKMAENALKTVKENTVGSKVKEYDNSLLEYFKNAQSVITVLFGTTLSLYYKVVRQDVTIAIRLTAAGKLKGKKAAAGGKGEKGEQIRSDRRNNVIQGTPSEEGESTAESASYTTEVENLFNWSF